MRLPNQLVSSRLRAAPKEVNIQKYIRSKPTKQGLGKTRMEALSDGIFAVSLTFLALEIKLPDFHNTNWWPDLWHHWVVFAASFLIVGIYWVAHNNEVRMIKDTYRWFLWRNLFFLFFIVLVPFSTEWLSTNWHPMGTWWEQRLPVWTYAGDLILAGLGLQAMWHYAEKKNLFVTWLKSPKQKFQIPKTTRRNLFGPFFYVLAILSSFSEFQFFNTPVSHWICVFVPVTYLLLQLLDSAKLRELRQKAVQILSRRIAAIVSRLSGYRRTLRPG